MNQHHRPVDAVYGGPATKFEAHHAKVTEGIQPLANAHARRLKIGSMRFSRLALNVLALFLVLLGVVWFFQGAGLLAGSFMTGESIWSAIGVIVEVGGLALLFAANSRYFR